MAKEIQEEKGKNGAAGITRRLCNGESMKKSRLHKPDKVLSKEKNNSESLDAGTPLNIGVSEKKAVPMKKDDASGNVPSTNHSSKELHSFFISGNEDVQLYLRKQLIASFMESSDSVNIEELGKIVKNSVDLLDGLVPKDQVEAMLAVQMVATHNLAMSLITTVRRSKNGISIEQFTHLANKTLRTFTSQVEALGKYRNKGTQKIVVEHVTVNEGGQAIVGSEIVQGGGIKKCMRNNPV